MLVRALLMRQSNVCHAFLKNKTVIFWKSYSLSTKRNLGITDKLMEWGTKKIEGKPVWCWFGVKHREIPVEKALENELIPNFDDLIENE